MIETALTDVQAGLPTWTEADLFAAVARALPDSLGGLDPVEVRRLLDGLTAHGLAASVVEQVAGERDSDLPVVPALRVATATAPPKTRPAATTP